MRSCKTIDWKQVTAKMESQPWAKALKTAMEEDFQFHCSQWPHTPPLEDSEWGHHYFCSECGVRLQFDYQKPYEHICPNCAKVFTGYPYDGSWRKILHTAIVSNMERGAILAHIPGADPKYGKFVHDNILFYAEHYSQYPERAKNAGIGKVYPQSLSEAIFVIAMERIMRMTYDLSLFTEEEYDKIGELFFRPAMDLLKPQVTMIHNIHTWMQGGVAACASYLGDQKELENTIYGEFGWMNQLKKGASEDGIWYEISNTYHYYTLNALLSLAWIAKENGIDLFREPAFAKMASGYPALAYPNGVWPAYNDGWFGSRIFENHAVYEELSYQNPEFEGLLAWMYENTKPEPYGVLNALFISQTKATGFPRASLQALLYGAAELPAPCPPAKKSFLYQDTGIAVLQNENMRVSVKFTGDGGGHDHNDKISIELFANGELLSYDPGTTGYALPFTGQWSRTSLAHNLVCINGQRQKNCAAELVSYDPGKVRARASKAYDGYVMEREISLTDNGFTDTYQVEGDTPAVMDWIFHCKGDLHVTLPKGITAEDAPPFTEENGYNQLMDIKTAKCDGSFEADFQTGRQTVHVAFDAEPGTQVFYGECYGKDMTDRFQFVMLRRKGAKTVFHQEFTIQASADKK